MLVFDGIVYSLQKYGGITNYFTNLINNLIFVENIDAQLMLYGNPQLSSSISIKLIQNKYRTLERYRSVSNIPDGSIMHSSYYRISKNKKVKNVITLYDFTYEKFNNKFRSIPHTKQKKKALQSADAILCISENTKNDLLYFYPALNSNKVFVTHLSAGYEFYSINISYKKRIKSPFVLFVGSRRGYKNFKIAVEGISLVKNISLSIIGGGKLTNKELALLSSKLPGRFTIYSGLDSRRLNELYNQAICLVYPSLYEGFGIPILEAMQANCPVICNDVSSIPEVAGDGAILLQQCNAESISSAIDTLNNEENFALYQNKGFENSLRFSWENTAKQTMDIYNYLMK